MNLGKSEPTMVGIDWGSSSLRLFLIGAAGEVLQSISEPLGILKVPNGDFETVLDQLLARWPSVSGLPIVASGMITSKNGWIETPYLPAPAGSDDLAKALLQASRDSKCGKVHFITGLITETGNRADVMRGEETQIAGAIEHISQIGGSPEGLFVLPGTHSKCVSVHNRRIVNFQTFMTGETFALMRQHSILGTLLEDGPFDAVAFEAGVIAATADDANILRDLFQVRTLPLLKKMPPTAMPDYLSGLLIGTEINASLASSAAEVITIIGRDDLALRYQTALKIAGRQSQLAAEDLAATGQYAIAIAAGLLA